MVVERKSGKQQIVLQARYTDDSPEEIGRQKFGERRRLNTTDYYILDLQTDEVVSNLPRTVQDCDSMLSTMVGMGSRIYIFGGQIHGDTSAVVPDTPKTRASYFLDLDNHQTGWKRADPPLTDDQLQLRGGVAFGGNMYFFRGSNFSCLCEVFDPQRYQWRRIKSPPPPPPPPGGDGKVHLHPTPPVLADYKNNRIIVCFNNISTMYAYYPSEDRWECVVEGFRGWLSYSHPVTLADGVIYVHFRRIMGFVSAFDIATKEWLNVQVSPDAVDNYQSYLHLHSYDVLLHLGNGILCLLACTYQDHEPDQTQTTSVHVVQFKVKLVNNNETKEVLVTPLSSKYYHLGSRCHVLSYLRL